MTRSHKYNDRDHHHPGMQQDEHLPKYFAKSGHVDTAPSKTKKDGGGKGNWGRNGDEILDESFNVKPRRRSNSSVEHGPRPLKSKFETVEPEPVFEEDVMGPDTASLDHSHDDNSSDTMSKTDNSSVGNPLEESSTLSSIDSDEVRK